MTRHLLAPVVLAGALALSGCGVTLVSDDATPSPTTSGSPASSGRTPDSTTDGTAGTPGASTSTTSDPDPGAGGDRITYASWQARMATAQKEVPCDRGPVTLSEPGSAVRLVGSCGTVTLQGDAVTVIAGDVEDVDVVGSGIVLVATSVGTVTFGADAFASEVYWVDGQPDLADQGAGNVARAIPEGR